MKKINELPVAFKQTEGFLISHFLESILENGITTEYIYKNSEVVITQNTFGYNYGTPFTIMQSDGPKVSVNGRFINNIKKARLYLKEEYLGTFDIVFSDHIKRTFNNYLYTVNNKGKEIIEMNKKSGYYTEYKSIKDIRTTLFYSNRKKILKSILEKDFYLKENILIVAALGDRAYDRIFLHKKILKHNAIVKLLKKGMIEGFFTGEKIYSGLENIMFKITEKGRNYLKK